MDNKFFDIRSVGRDDFALAMRIAFSHKRSAIGYRIHENTLILYWVLKEGQSIPLPYEVDADQAIDFVWGWLQKSKPSSGQPDHDGDNGKGFRIYCEDWGHVLGDYQAFVGITPIWAMYGK